MLRTLTIWAILYGLYQKTDLFDTQTPVWDDVTPEAPTESTCAGSVFGQTLYRLLIIDTVAFVLSVTGTHLVRYHIM